MRLAGSRIAAQMAIDFTIANCIATLYTPMIRNFRHKGLRLFFETGSLAGIRPDHAKRLQLILTTLEMAKAAEDMNLPGMHFHGLDRTLKGHYGVKVLKNWRVTFSFKDGDAIDVNYQDYH
jgi:proteic killer suppression protein